MSVRDYARVQAQNFPEEVKDSQVNQLTHQITEFISTFKEMTTKYKRIF